MGRSTIAELVARGQNWNSYNNTGIQSTALWIDAFNSCLKDLVEDIGLIGKSSISYLIGTTEYTLPDDYFEVVQITDAGQFPIRQRQYLVEPFPCADSYFIRNIGSGYEVSFDERNTTETLTLTYVRYPEILSISTVSTQRPEVPSIGEDALIYYAISRSLRNNNQPGQATELEGMYERERKKIRDAKYRAAAGW